MFLPTRRDKHIHAQAPASASTFTACTSALGETLRLATFRADVTLEYQLFAQQQRPGGFGATASYGDGGPGYIPLEKSFAEGGYEPTQSFVVPESEKVMRETIVELLRAK